MRKTMFAAMLMLAAGVAWAAAGLDEFVMETIDDASKSLASNIAQQDADAASADAHTLDTLFIEVEKYFVERGDAPDGVDMARRSRALISAVSDAVAAKDFDAAANTASELSRHCKACHRAYKKDD
jgi:hypothetical protein